MMPTRSSGSPERNHRLKQLQDYTAAAAESSRGRAVLTGPRTVPLGAGSRPARLWGFGGPFVPSKRRWFLLMRKSAEEAR